MVLNFIDMLLRQMMSHASSIGCVYSTLYLRIMWHNVCSQVYSNSLLESVLKTRLFENLPFIRHLIHHAPLCADVIPFSAFICSWFNILQKMCEWFSNWLLQHICEGGSRLCANCRLINFLAVTVRLIQRLENVSIFSTVYALIRHWISWDAMLAKLLWHVDSFN